MEATERARGTEVRGLLPSEVGLQRELGGGRGPRPSVHLLADACGLVGWTAGVGL